MSYSNAENTIFSKFLPNDFQYDCLEKIVYQKLAKNLSDKEKRENIRGNIELYEAPKASISVL